MAKSLGLAALAAVCVHVGAASADAPVRVSLTTTSAIVQGERGAIEIRVEGLPADAPMMLTPRVLGESVALLTGRLLRADAQTSDEHAQLFSLPFSASAQGSAEVAVTLVAYVCAARCEELTRSVSTRVVVRAP